ncbi:MAG: hypothetical protein ACJ764_02945 [Solirubrobacteraceae bacterium]
MITSSRALRSIVPSSRALHALDIALAVWVLAWIGLGVAIGVELSNLSSLSHTAIVDGRAVESVGRSLGLLGNVPFVGGSLAGVSHQVQVAGASAVSGGISSQSSIHALSVLLAIAVALLPSVPVFGFYLPVRLDLRRESQALSQAVRVYGDDPAFQAFLARRAIDSLGYHRLRRLAALPWSASATDADRAELAAAELRRLGVDPSVLERSAQSNGQIRERSRN